MLEWLENWFISQCNNDWEHNYGIKIETIDNPGWQIVIDLEYTDFNINPIEWKLIGDFEKQWIGYKVVNNQFDGACDPRNLNLLINIFKNIIDKNEIDFNNIEKKLRT